MDIRFDNSYARLPQRFYTPLEAEPVSEPRTIHVNEELARRLGFDPEWLASEEGAAFAVGNRTLDGSEPIATVYAGHQFGGWVPRLGDGRALLLGEVLDATDQRWDIQLKGSGRTPYSRRGDGRSPLGPVLREALVSEAMAALGIPTTRTLVAASTGDEVHRDRALPGGVLVRVAKSHIRVGTFQYFAARNDTEAVQRLRAHVIERHYPDLEPDDALGLLERVARRQAELIADWMLVGFIHGVMNTDNMLLSGETIDYGPCAFMNEYDPSTVYSSIDRQGRYAYGNQPPIAQWNLARLAEALLRGEQDDRRAEAEAILDAFPDWFRQAYGGGMAAKLGFEFRESDWPLLEDLLELMYETEADYTLTFRRLTELAAPDLDGPGVGAFFELPDRFEGWLQRWRERRDEENSGGVERMRQANPVLIPRNHRVEQAIDAAVEDDDFAPFHELMTALRDPYELGSEAVELARPPRTEERVQATFCGT